jgi:hypothetical protein
MKNLLGPGSVTPSSKKKKINEKPEEKKCAFLEPLREGSRKTPES